MQGDSVEIFKHYISTQMEMDKRGITVKRVLKLSTLALGLGQPEKAFLLAKQVTDLPDSVDEDARKALHLCAFAHALKAAILERDAVGAPQAVDMSDDPMAHRLKAMNILEGMDDLQMQEEVLLRKLQGRLGLGYVTTHIASLVKGLGR